jgi:hypothetical protein
MRFFRGWYEPTCKDDVAKTETFKGKSHKTFNMAEHLVLNGRATIMVTSKTSGKKVMVERAMCWNSRGAGTDTIGGDGDSFRASNEYSTVPVMKQIPATTYVDQETAEYRTPPSSVLLNL